MPHPADLALLVGPMLQLGCVALHRAPRLRPEQLHRLDECGIFLRSPRRLDHCSLVWVERVDPPLATLRGRAAVHVPGHPACPPLGAVLRDALPQRFVLVDRSLAAADGGIDRVAPALQASVPGGDTHTHTQLIGVFGVTHLRRPRLRPLTQARLARPKGGRQSARPTRRAADPVARAASPPRREELVQG